MILSFNIDNCLFIGNGLNQCIDQDLSWSKLLGLIEEKYCVKYVNRNLMAIEFERMANEFAIANQSNSKWHKRKNKNLIFEFKHLIAKRVKELDVLPNDAVHRYLLSISNVEINSIITSNYDGMLEQLYIPGSEVKHIDPMYKKRNCFHFPDASIANSIQIYHIHGVDYNSRSICLGYNHYAIILQELQKEISQKGDSGKPAIIDFLNNYDESDNYKLKWSERFFVSNIAFIGFSLDTSEIDLWWLIAYRASLFYSDSYSAKRLIRNKLVFYDLVKCDNLSASASELLAYTPQEKRDFYTLLNQFHIEINLQPMLEKQWAEGYKRIIDDINEKGFSGNIII